MSVDLVAAAAIVILFLLLYSLLFSETPSKLVAIITKYDVFGEYAILAVKKSEKQ